MILKGTGRAQKVWSSVAEGFDPFRDEAETIKVLGRAAAAGLQEHFPAEVQLGRLAGGGASTVVSAPDGTTKFLVDLRDGLSVESVLIPTADRTTLCVSSQASPPCRTSKTESSRVPLRRPAILLTQC